jgi:hypothetical protein
MQVKNQTIAKDETRDLSLLIETASDLVAGLQELAEAVELRLGASPDVEDVIALLWRKKSKVDTLNAVAREITSRLRLTADGQVGVTVPEGLKVRFRELMADFQRLLDHEARIEDLIAGRGFPVSRRLR